MTDQERLSTAIDNGDVALATRLASEQLEGLTRSKKVTVQSLAIVAYLAQSVGQR